MRTDPDAASNIVMEAGYFGSSVRRREDPALLSGHGRFLDDITLPGLLYVVFVRSPHAHARIRRIDTEAASRLTGVIGAFKFADLAQWLKPLPSLTTPPSVLTARIKLTLREPTRYPLAADTVRYVGEAVAVIVAQDRYVAADALALVDVQYDPLPVVVDAQLSISRDSPILHPGSDDNVAVRFTCSVGDVAAAFARAEVHVRDQLRVQRQGGMPLETRGAVAVYEPRDGTVTTWTSTQLPHFVQQEVADVLSTPAHKVRVIAPDVGGGFGTKACSYGEEVIVPLLARELGRPLKWVEERREHFIAAAHSRDQHQDIEVAATRDGHILGVRGRIVVDVGAYNPGGFILAYNTVAHLLGPYRVPNVSIEVVGAFTNKVPAAPYRGAGRPEAAFAMDRALDRLARQISLDPMDLRLINMVGPDQMPYDTGLLFRDGTPLIYDSGDYPQALRKAAELVAYSSLRADQAKLRQRGIYRGVGISAYVEGTALGPYESASVQFDRTGHAIVATGACSQGQGHETTFAQIAADTLGVPIEWVTVIGGDTGRAAFGVGTFVSRSAVMAGNAIALAARQVRAKLLEAAASILEVRIDDIEIARGKVFVRGTPSRTVALDRIIRDSLPTYDDAGRPPFEAAVFYHPPTVTYASGVHIAVVDVDPEIGTVSILDYAVVHDCGRVIHPVIVEGQIHGGVAQGIGGALLEEIAYNESGQLENTTFLDYAMPRARNVPRIATAPIECPSPRNPLGVKGIGEGGAVSPPAAIANAIEDALAPLRVHITETPVTPRRLMRLIKLVRFSADGSRGPPRHV
jgi:aerobic carbon-monoxide dehydrogenase large subunit